MGSTQQTERADFFCTKKEGKQAWGHSRARERVVDIFDDLRRRQIGKSWKNFKL
jgi:hypothetical protein